MSASIDAQAATISGTVYDQQGDQVKGAEVCLVCASYPRDGCRGRPPRCLLSDAAGRFAMLSVPPGDYGLSASKEGVGLGRYAGGQTLAATGTQTAARYDIVLSSEGVRASGHVLDIAGGPVAGAEVHAIVLGDQGGLAATGRSDERGAFELWVPARSGIRFQAQLKGYATGHVIRVAPSASIDIVLTPAAHIAGRVVVRGTGSPVASARVRASSGSRSFALHDDVFATTQADGRFVLQGLRPGDHWLVAEGAGYRGEMGYPVGVGLADIEREVVLEVEPAVRVQGRIASRSGEPCTDGRVDLLQVAAPGQSARMALSLMSRSDSQGWVIFEAVPAGEYQAQVECWGYALAEGPSHISVRDRDLLDLRWTTEGGLQVDVLVLDPADEPVANTQVSLKLQGATRKSYSYLTGPAGRYSFRGLLPGRYVAYAASLAGVDPTPFELRIGDPPRELRLRVPHDSSLQVRVVSADDQPLDGWVVYASREDDAFPYRYQAAPLGNGRYEIAPLVAGNYAVTAHDEQNPPITSDPVQVRPGMPTSLLLQAPAHNASIYGMVVDAQGAPIPDAWISVVSTAIEAEVTRSDPLTRMRLGETRVLTDALGRFELPGLREDQTYTLRAQLFDTHQEAVETSVAPAAEVRIVLPDPLSLSGTVVDAEGAPVTSFVIAAVSQANGAQRMDTVVDEEGRWSLNGVVPGPTQVYVVAGEGKAKLSLNAVKDQDIGSLHLTPPRPATPGGAASSVDQARQ